MKYFVYDPSGLVLLEFPTKSKVESFLNGPDFDGANPVDEGIKIIKGTEINIVAGKYRVEDDTT